jgi:beta-lactamase class A
MRLRLICLAVFVLAVITASSSTVAAKPGAKQPPFPWHKRVQDATRFLSARAGAASFAVVDERGRIHGHRRGVQFSSGSLVKAMLLVA